MAKKTNRQVKINKTMYIILLIFVVCCVFYNIFYAYNYFSNESKEKKVRDAAELYVLSNEVGYEVKTESKILYKGKYSGSDMDAWFVAVKWYYDSGKDDYMTTVVKVTVHPKTVDPCAMTDSYHINFDEITNDMIKQMKIMWEIQ